MHCPYRWYLVLFFMYSLVIKIFKVTWPLLTQINKNFPSLALGIFVREGPKEWGQIQSKRKALLNHTQNPMIVSIYRYSFKWFYPTNRPTKASMSTCTWKSSNWMIRPLISYGTSMIYDFLSSYGSKHWHFVSYILLVSLALLLFDKQILDRIICFHTKQNLKLDHKERYHNCWGPVDLC
mgnify:FL=1